MYLDYFAYHDGDIRIEMRCPDCRTGAYWKFSLEIGAIGGSEGNSEGKARFRTTRQGTGSTFGGSDNDAGMMIAGLARAPSDQSAEVSLWWAQGPAHSTPTKIFRKSFIVVYAK